ncbi:MAG: hypothetical protein ABH869_08080 [Candidatus Omnitrophota bacterium]
MKGVSILIIALFLVCGMAEGIGFAQEKSFKKASEEAASAAINYPANLVNETVKVVGDAVRNTAEVVVDTVKVTGETLAGDGTKAPEIIATPVSESAETIKDAVVGIAQVPMKAAEKTADQIK